MGDSIDNHDMLELLNTHDPSVGIFAVGELTEEDRAWIHDCAREFDDMHVESFGETDKFGYIREFTIIEQGERIRFYYESNEYSGQWKVELVI